MSTVFESYLAGQIACLLEFAPMFWPTINSYKRLVDGFWAPVKPTWGMTFPFGAYVAVVDIDRFTGETKVRRFYALDDCGTRINPMIIEEQIQAGLRRPSASPW